MSSLYDLMLLLDSDAPRERREEILREVESAVGAGGSLESKHDWGIRRLSYEIDHRGEAEYHLLQFTGPPELLESLRRTLKLIDGIVRFRIIKVRPGTPSPPTVRSEPPVEDATRSPAPAETPASG
ncbi:MAG: 30S ribosomal protein S6 [Solirubrobacteraceae bacterium]